MLIYDLIFMIQWWGVIFAIGLVFLPISSLIFKNFFDKGYIFSKVLGIIVISYVVFILGILKILPFTQLTIFLVIVFFAGINILTLKKYWKLTIEQFNNSPRGEAGRTIFILLFEEIIFFTALLFWSYIRSHQPDIYGLEKYMDFGFVNSILRSSYFPPPDMWLTPHAINYYYFGHLFTAVLTKLSGIPSFITYNLMIATLFAFTFSCSFSIGFNLFSKSRKGGADVERLPAARMAFERSETSRALTGRKLLTGPLLAGLLSAFLVSFAGNLHAIYLFFKPYNVENPVAFWQLIFSPETFPNAYWYPNATRFIYNTIHEFPIYSFVVSDLHGHVLSIPIVLTIIAFLLHEFLQGKQISIQKIILLSFLLATAYMTNAWDGPIYFLLTALVISFLNLKSLILNLKFVVLVLIGSILFALPFSLNFKPFVSGIGVICAPQFLIETGKIGPFLFEANHCLRSPVWQLFILYGFFYFWVFLFLLKIKRFKFSDFFVLFLILLATFLIIIPEFFYIKDIYPAHYRANTMFKLVYESFIMLSLSSGYIIMRIITNFQLPISNFKLRYILPGIGIIGLLLVMMYPYFAISSYYGDLKQYQGLDGTQYLKKIYSDDYAGVMWLNAHIKTQPVILEAQGDSYTDYARVSANTGLPTVLGWLVHEWLWRGSYDIPSPRIADVKILYETKDLRETKKLIDKYRIELIFIGNLEREKYPDLQESKFKKLGKRVFQSGETIIYKIY